MLKGIWSFALLLLVGVLAVGSVVATADAGELTCTLEHTNYTFDNPWPLADQEARRQLSW